MINFNINRQTYDFWGGVRVWVSIGDLGENTLETDLEGKFL